MFPYGIPQNEFCREKDVFPVAFLLSADSVEEKLRGDLTDPTGKLIDRRQTRLVSGRFPNPMIPSSSGTRIPRSNAAFRTSLAT